MIWIPVLTFVFWPRNTVTNVKAESFLFGPKPDDNQTSGLCQLPPYPQRGGYVVLGRGEAAPGDTFDDVSLVQYTTDENNQLFQINRFTCSLGEWYQDIFKYKGKELYFYTSWCPYFCSSFSSEQWTECPPPDVDRNTKGVPQSGRNVFEEHTGPNNTRSGFCHLPPYPSHGTYVVQNSPDAGPGDTFQNVSLIQYTSDELNAVVTIKHFRCSWGLWYQKIFQEANESLHFYSSWCPALCSQCFGKKLADRHSWLLENRTFTKKEQIKSRTTLCALPSYPEFGTYSLISETETTQPGDLLDALRLNYTCSDGYTLMGNRHVYCLKGVWSDNAPKCRKFCRLIRQPGVEYTCVEEDSDVGFGPCGGHVQDGAVVIPRCSSPYYKSKASLIPMTCVNGEWNNVPDCRPVCGLRVQSKDRPAADDRLKAPWHVVIFDKRFTAHTRQCGGSIVARNLVITGAACFTSSIKDGIIILVDYFVIAGKLYHTWYQPNDDKAQGSDVEDIRVPPLFTDRHTNYQHDIALVFLTTPLEFNEYVWPLCLNFDKNLDDMQLAENRLGLVAGWGKRDSEFSEVLRVMKLPIIDPHTCVIKIQAKRNNAGEYVTSDKICAGYDNGTALFREDNGGGLAVPETDPTDPRKSYYYLRGIVSTHILFYVETYSFTIFTKVSAHENFIKSNIDEMLF